MGWVLLILLLLVIVITFITKNIAILLIAWAVFLLVIVVGGEIQKGLKSSSGSSSTPSARVTIHCPTCGDPVIVRGDRWECGWCGDFGDISSLNPSEKAKLVQSDALPIRFTVAVDDCSDEKTPYSFSQAELEDMVRRWDFDKNEWACRDLLIVAFPDAVRHWTVKELSDMLPMDILLGVADRQPETAIRMMKLLLNTAEEHLQDEEVAQQLLAWDLYDLLVRDDMLPLLVEELKWDDRLAWQIFQSAYVGPPQEAILNACGRLGEKELQQKLLKLLDHNPCPHDEIKLEADEE